MSEATGATADKPLPMAGIRVLDAATFQAAPFCATILGEFGAEVIKVEQPGAGDPLRAYGTIDPCGDSYIWLSEARNKKSITLDLRNPKGKEIFKRLAGRCDVLCENFRPGTLEKWGLGYETLRADQPGLVMLRVSAYGQTGPDKDKPGFARIAHAFSGVSYLNGDPDRPPASPGIAALGDYLGGLYGALGVLLALRAREQSGEGQYIDVSLYEPIFRMLDEVAPVYAKRGIVRERMGADMALACPHSHYPTADGKWVAISCSSDKMFERLAGLMGRPELAAADAYGKTAARLAARDEMNRLVGDWTAGLDRDEVLRLCDAADMPAGPVYSIADIFADPQYAARGDLLKILDPRAGELVVPGVFPVLSETPGRLDHAGPALGAQNDEVYGGLLGMGADDIAALRRDGVI